MEILILIWWELNSLVCESWFKQQAYRAYACVLPCGFSSLVQMIQQSHTHTHTHTIVPPSLGGKGSIKTRSAKIKFIIVAMPKKLVTQIASSVSVNLEKGLSSLLLSLDPYGQRSRRLTVRILPCWQLLPEVLGQQQQSWEQAVFQQRKILLIIAKLLGKVNFPSLSLGSFGWPNNQIDWRQINSRKTNFISYIQKSIDIRPKKWPNQAVDILF